MPRVLIPWATDAPVYHRPWGTIGLILVNILIFFGELHADPETQGDLVLRFGDGYHPVQWLTNHFLHADIMHLLGNMVFLWVFGLIVEGKLGWRRFLPLYLGICLIDSVIVQSAMLAADEGGALGASGAIFALMLISEASLATGRWGLERSDLLALIDTLIAERAFREVRPLLDEALHRFPDAEPGLRLHEARMLLDLRRPARALELLDALAPDTLDAHQQAERERLRATARALVAEGVLEIDD